MLPGMMSHAHDSAGRLCLPDEPACLAGFGAIEMNPSNWRDELPEESAATG